jgi:hypothetical protein
MPILDPEKLHVRFIEPKPSSAEFTPRRYTLTHSDRTGDLFLTIAGDFNLKQVSGFYTRLMRDEVLAEWRDAADGPELHVFCHVSGGLVLGSASWRASIFEHHMPQVLQAFRYGDREHFQSNPVLDRAPVYVHFRARQAHLNKAVFWGTCGEFTITVD